MVTIIRTKSTKLAALHAAEKTLAAEAAKVKAGPLFNALDAAARSLRTIAVVVEQTTDETKVAEVLDRAVGQLTRSLGLVVRYNPEVAARVGNIPMTLAVEVCSET